MTLIAKPLLKNQLWIVVGEQGKVGNVVADGTGFTLNLEGQEKHYDNTDSITKLKKIEFQRPVKNRIVKKFSDYPTDSKTYNDVMDIKRKIHIYTKTPKSKCYHAAGWYKIKFSDEWETVLCPKYIFIQRYDYQGPYMTENEAKNN